LNQLITESEKFANLLGGIGRRMYARSKRRYQMDQIEFSTAVRNAVNDERKKWEEDEARALKALDGQMDFVTETAKQQQQQLSELSFQVRCMTAYVEYEADWHHKLRMLLLKLDPKVGIVSVDDLPHHMDYTEFENKCKESKNTNWRRWTT
jgi:hypothetical protein